MAQRKCMKTVAFNIRRQDTLTDIKLSSQFVSPMLSQYKAQNGGEKGQSVC
jgi:hypothetical protein